MASLNMAGPFEYSQAEIDSIIPENIIGNYALGFLSEDGNTFYVSYVGRSDKDLHKRISHSLGKYTHFKVSQANTIIEAYQKECRNWHDFGGEEGRLDNEIHPDKPDNMLAFCPICSQRIIDSILLK